MRALRPAGRQPKAGAADAAPGLPKRVRFLSPLPSGGALPQDGQVRATAAGCRLAAVGALVLSLMFAPAGPVHADAGATPCTGAVVSATGPQDTADQQCPASASERARGLAVVAVALTTLGTPYAWGGGDTEGPTIGFCDRENGYLDGVCQADHTVGFDCSGLALYSWYQASGGAIALPHYSVFQHDHGRHLDRGWLIPGDLLFFAEPDGPIHHVGIYLGHGAMIHAERTGTVVSILGDVFDDPTWGPRYVGATRPAR